VGSNPNQNFAHVKTQKGSNIYIIHIQIVSSNNLHNRYISLRSFYHRTM